MKIISVCRERGGSTTLCGGKRIKYLTEVYTSVYTSVMNTKFIGIKDFRSNIAEYAQQARTDGVRYIVMSRNKPLFEVKPFTEDEYLDSVVASVVKAEAEVTAGKVISHEALVKKLGLD